MIGTERDFRGQRYQVVQTFERPRRNGTLATILVWQSGCHECGEPFTFSTPAASPKFEPNRRCAKHKRPGHRVLKEGTI